MLQWRKISLERFYNSSPRLRAATCSRQPEAGEGQSL